jgi:hypothetical protein
MNGTFSASGIELDTKTLSYYGGNDVFIAKQSRSYAISGMIYDYSEQVVTSGMVYLYKHLSTGPYQLIDSVSIDAEAYYMFNNLGVGKFIVKAVPNSNQYPSLMTSYYPDVAMWKDALMINTEKGSYNNANIYLMEDPPNNGTAAVMGAVSTKNTKISKTGEITDLAGEPVKGVSVILKGKKKIDKDMYDLVKTSSDGAYKFTNVDKGSYSIMVDYPGMEQGETYDIDVVEDQDTYENYNYVMIGDTIHIAESDTTTDIEGFSGNDAPEITVYPNPASNYLFVETEENTNINQVRLLSVNGRMIFSREIIDKRNRFRLNLEGMKEGIYFLRIQTTSDEIVRRLIVQ